ncbi:DNA methyltransferase [Blautia sp. Marseille-P3201T]|uniref:DNA methyltransferase n=1 Tax=Blautia sp. Marseille-P3201T TaxID=1907659 RepID=UPI000930582D|nr:DNA methyltransferase [Blautia sp. Marseille-P3201T]
MQSIVSYKERGIGGNNLYRGNCSPRLIEDLIDFYKVKNISDYMCGSGTTKDVADRKNIKANVYDLNQGFDLLNMDVPERNEFIFWHPPYHNMIRYADNMYAASEIEKKYGICANEVDLSQCRSWEDFIKKLNACMIKQFASLETGGHMAVLMGDLKKQGKLYSMLLEIAKPGIIENIVIKVQHNCMSNKNQYANENFIRIQHEYVLLLKKAEDLIYPVQFAVNRIADIRNLESVTWKDVIADIIEKAGGKIELHNIYQQVSGYKKAEKNNHVKEKVRQTLYAYRKIFFFENGLWYLS